MNGIQATRQIREHFPEVRILVLTTYDFDEWVFEAFARGQRLSIEGHASRAVIRCHPRTVEARVTSIHPWQLNCSISSAALCLPGKFGNYPPAQRA